MECALCLRLPADGVLMQVGDTAEVCADCASRIEEQERQAMLPLVVAGLAVFLDHWSQAENKLDCTGDARQFWTDLQRFGDLDEQLHIAAALEALLSAAATLNR
jgi:hypothetical protein